LLHKTKWQLKVTSRVQRVKIQAYRNYVELETFLLTMTKYYSQKYFIFSPKQPSFIETITIYIHTQRIIKHSLKKDYIGIDWRNTYLKRWFHTLSRKFPCFVIRLQAMSLTDSFSLQAEVSGKCDESIVCLRPCNSLRREQLLLRRDRAPWRANAIILVILTPTRHLILLVATRAKAARQSWGILYACASRANSPWIISSRCLPDGSYDRTHIF